MTASETLQDALRPSESDALLPNSRPPTSPSQHEFTLTLRARRIIGLRLATIVFFLVCGGGLMGVPFLRLFEDVICHHYYDNIEGEGHIGYDGKIDESLCKVDEVQNELNVTLAGLYFLGSIPGLLTSIPYGLLADRKGRKFVLLLSFGGMILSGLWNIMAVRFWRVLPLRLVWLASAFMFIGGGPAVTTMVFYTIAADILPESRRSTVFLIGASPSLFAELWAPSAASGLMKTSPWIPLLIGQATFTFGASLVFWLPETLNLRPSETAEQPADFSSHRSSSSKVETTDLFTLIKAQVVERFKRIHQSTTVLHSLPVLLLLLAFVTGPFADQLVRLSLRYISNRFMWELREVGFLLSLRAFVNIVLLLVILPAFSYYLTAKHHLSVQAKDLTLAQFSAVMYVLGALLVAASPTVGLTIFGLVVWTLGTGFVPLARSLATTLVDREHVALLYSAIAVVETSSSLTAGPSVAALYALALKLKGPWIGLPFYGIAVISFLGGLGVWCFRFVVKKQEDEMPDTAADGTVPLHRDTTEE